MGDERSAIEVIAAARDRTYAAGGARCELRTAITHDPPDDGQSSHRRGGLLRPLLPPLKAAGGSLLRAVVGDSDPFHETGVVDLQGRRYAVDRGGTAEVFADGKTWIGSSGTALGTAGPDGWEHLLLSASPLWLCDIVVDVVEATDAGMEDVHGIVCRRFATTIDLGRASSATPGGVAVPAAPRFEDLLALPVDVLVDDERLRRVRYRRTKAWVKTLDLWDFGIPLDEVDWTRLPTFRTPSAGDTPS